MVQVVNRWLTVRLGDEGLQAKAIAQAEFDHVDGTSGTISDSMDVELPQSVVQGLYDALESKGQLAAERALEGAYITQRQERFGTSLIVGGDLNGAGGVN